MGTNTVIIEKAPSEKMVMPKFQLQAAIELLFRVIFSRFHEVKTMIESWQMEKNMVSPSCPLGYRLPAADALHSPQNNIYQGVPDVFTFLGVA
jgi:hypothetical protein